MLMSVPRVSSLSFSQAAASSALFSQTTVHMRGIHKWKGGENPSQNLLWILINMVYCQKNTNHCLCLFKDKEVCSRHLPLLLYTETPLIVLQSTTYFIRVKRKHEPCLMVEWKPLEIRTAFESSEL